jgi:hypothetical protein
LNGHGPAAWLTCRLAGAKLLADQLQGQPLSPVPLVQPLLQLILQQPFLLPAFFTHLLLLLQLLPHGRGLLRPRAQRLLNKPTSIF